MDEMGRKIEKEEFLKRTEGIRNPSALLRIIQREFGIPCVWIYCVGECLGKTNDVSKIIKEGPNIFYDFYGKYGTKEYFYFWRTTRDRGEELEYEGETWLVVLNDYRYNGSCIPLGPKTEVPGDNFFSVSEHSLVLVRLSALLS